MTDEKIKIGITHGDINGVGYEIILKAFEAPEMFELCTPVVYGSLKIASFYRKHLGLQPIAHQNIDSPDYARADALNFVNVVGEDLSAEPGQSTPAAGAAALAALERAVADLKAGKIDCLVTAPINKANIQGETFAFAGHTEYLHDRLGDELSRPLMIMADSNGLRVALVTIHLPVAGVATAITRGNVAQKIVDFSRALQADFAVHSPRIAVLALNPHAGDGGLLGQEEGDVILPAIEQACAEGVLAYGPYSADGFFGAAHHRRFDGVLAMYHDQGLTPFKTIAGNDGVNFTAGLPWVRTSPDHGTAYDIAGQGKADPQSMRQAIYMAIDAVRHRRNHAEATANPLKKLYQDRPSRD